MKKLIRLLFVLSTTFSYLTLRAQNQDDMKAMMAYMAPGEVHQMMGKTAGTWVGTITMWMQPGAAPVTMTGETKNEMILGGRYLQSKNTGTMMGMPFEGIGTTGYDNAKKIFVTSWIDNAGTGMIYLEGTWDAQNKMVNYSGKMVDPASGKDMQIRETWKFVDDNTQIVEMFAANQGKEFKTMEIKYTRK